MRCLTSALLLFAVAAAAGCGGRVDDPAPSSTPGSNSPSNAPTTTGCAGACDHFHACGPGFDDRERCISSCASEFTDPARARIYGSCIQSVSCAELERGLSMDYGPIGECQTRAKKHD